MALLATGVAPCAAQTTATSPAPAAGAQWSTEYFDGDASCTEPAAAWNAANASQWKPLSLSPSTPPVVRDNTLWVRIARADMRDADMNGVAVFAGRRIATVYYGFEADFLSGGVSNITSGGRRVSRLEEPTVLDLPDPWPAGQVWYLCIASPRPFASAVLTLQPAAAHREATIQRARWVMGCFAVMLTMLVSALFFGWTLKDRVYLFYVGHVSAFMVFQAVRNQVVSSVTLLWPLIASFVGSGLSVLCAWHFLSEFLLVVRKLPRLDRWLRRLAWCAFLASCAVPVIVSFVGIAHSVTTVALALMNALTVVVCAGALFVVSYLAAKGQRFAGYLLLGWMPLFVVAVLSAVEIIADVPQRQWGQWVLPAAT